MVGPKGGDEATRKLCKVLSVCYRRAVYTRVHAQLDHDAMFRSLDAYRCRLQKISARVEPEQQQQRVADVIGELDFSERCK